GPSDARPGGQVAAGTLSVTTGAPAARVTHPLTVVRTAHNGKRLRISEPSRLAFEGAARLRCRRVRSPAAAQNVLEPVIAFVAGGLRDHLAGQVHRQPTRDRLGEPRRIVHGEFVLEGFG